MPVHHIDLRKREPEVSRYSLNQYANDIAVAFQGQRYILSGGSSGWTKTEDIEHSFTSYIGGLYKTNGIVFAIILARMLLFTEARFCWFEINDNGEDGRPKGRKGLEVLERPWPNCGTGELLARMEQDVSLGGNFYAVREGNRLRRLRPDWVTIVLTAPPAESTYSDVAGYWYHPGRSFTNAGEPGPGDEVYLPDECAHWSPLPDPDAQYRGMSWLTPVVREVMADKASMEHKLNFFTNGATLGAIISAKESLTNNQYKEWKANFEGVHSGAANAYKSLFLASPVDVSVLSANMQQLDFKVTTGAGETRLCAAGGVPPIIVGLSEGLASATYSNYGMARRKFGDHWAHPQWKSASQALSGLVDPPDGDVRLGVNTKGIAFLREDAKDLAEIEQIKASTLSTLIMAGYEPDSCVAAVEAEDLTLLKHSGLTSVQLVPPGTAEGSPEDVAAEEEYDVLLQEFRSRRPERGEIVRKFNPDQPRIPGGHLGGGRWTDGGIFTKIFKFGGKEVSVTAHTDGSSTLTIGGRSVRLTGRELAGPYGEGNSLRSMSFDAIDWDPGDASAIDRPILDESGKIVRRQNLVGIKKVAEPPDVHPNGDPEEETWDLTPLALLFPDDDGFMDWDNPVATMRQRDVERLTEQARGMEAKRVPTLAGEVDVYRDGGRVVVRPRGGEPQTLDRKSARALYRAINDLADDDERDPRPDGETEERVVQTNLGEVRVRMTGDNQRTVATFSDGTELVTGGTEYDTQWELWSALDAASGSVERAKLAGSDEIQRDRYDVRNPAGSVGGGRFRKLSDAIVALLRDAEGDEDPLEDLTQPQLKKAAEQLGLTEPRKRYTKAQLKVALLKHARGDEPDERPKAKPAAKKAVKKAAPAKKVAPPPRAGSDTPAPGRPGGKPSRAEGSDLLRDSSSSTALAESLQTDTPRSATGDVLMASIAERQGFDGQPAVVSDEELRDLIEQGYQPLFRGVANHGTAVEMESEFADQLRTGRAHYAGGAWGTGIYTSRQLHTARLYGPDPLRMALRPDARVAEWKDLAPEHRAFLDGLAPDDPAREVFSDQGRYAAARGYDALRITGSLEDEVLIFNRSALVVQGPAARKAATPRAKKPASAADFSGNYASRQAAIRGASGEPEVTPLEGGVTAASVDLLTYPDGTRVVRKDYGPRRGDAPSEFDHMRADHEELAALVLDAVGVPTAAVVRVDDTTIDMEFVDGVQGGRTGELKAPASVRGSETGRLLGLADAIMGLRDRAGGNWMRVGGDIVAIDNGNAFNGVGADTAAGGNPFTGYLMGRHEGDPWASSIELPEGVDIPALRRRLEALRPEFERLGYRRQHKDMLGRLAEIERRAKPSRRSDPESAARQRQADIDSAVVEARVIDAYQRLRGEHVGWVGLAGLRRDLGDVSREDLDRTLLKLVADGKIRLIPEENQKTITVADSDAALSLAGEPKHLIMALDPNDPLDRPLPRAPTPDPLSSLRTLDPEAARDALDLKKVPDLKALIRQANERDAGLPVSGRKRDLVDRLVGHLHPGGGEGAAAEADVTPELRREIEVENRIRAAYRAALVGRRERPEGAGPALVGLADIRDALSDLSRDEQDDAIDAIRRQDGVRVIPVHNTKGLTSREFDAALHIPRVDPGGAGQDMHAISIVDPSDRPLPAPRADLSVSRDERIRQLMATGMTRKQATEQIRQENASRSTEPDEDDIERADYDDHPGEPDDEMRARAQACLDDCDEDAEEPDDADYDMYRAAGADTNLGGERLHYWWTKGPGLARWVNSPHPWTALYTQLREHVGAARAKRMASAWFHEVFGIWSGERKGSNPVGPG